METYDDTRAHALGRVPARTLLRAPCRIPRARQAAVLAAERLEAPPHVAALGGAGGAGQLSLWGERETERERERRKEGGQQVHGVREPGRESAIYIYRERESEGKKERERKRYIYRQTDRSR